MVEEGKIRWDTTIGEIFPEFAATIRPEYKNVTLEMLLELRGGLKAYFDAEQMRTIPLYTGSLLEQRHSFTQYILQLAPDSTPGEYNYSNSCYVVAATMLEKATGKSWDTLARERLYDPLGISTVGIG